MSGRPQVRAIAAGALLAAAVGLVAWAALRGAEPSPPAAPPSTPSDATGCERCHTEPVPDHAGAPCVACHLGDPSGDTVPQGHLGMEPEPGALETAARTCGACHPIEHQRVATSLMTTGVGLVAVDRWALGEVDSPNHVQTLAEVLAAESPTPAEDHLRRLCAGCHLGTRRDNRDDAVQGTGSGCGACHVLTDGPDDPRGHPDIEGIPGDASCLGCHSRSSRISLSYQGLAEISGSGLDACADQTRLYDGRHGCVLPADAHHEAGLACVDCHLHTELMGDGEAHVHKDEALEVHCETCHGPEAPTRTWADVDDPITTAILKARGQERAPSEAVRVGAEGTPLWNVRPTPEGWAVHPKHGGAAVPIPPTPADADHTLPGHERLHCDTCHTQWAPACTTCHTDYDPTGQQWDFGAARVMPGHWRETADGMSTGQPALGVTAKGDIVPAVPGMVMTYEPPDGPTREQRLFAPAAPHTTGPGLACAKCHRAPVPIGIGTGELSLGTGGASFQPTAPSDRPDRSADGWVGLREASPGSGTRLGFRSLDRAERERVLRVGVCLACHTGQEPWFQTFDASVDRWRKAPGSCELSPDGWSW